MTAEGRPYYVDHNTASTHWDPPPPAAAPAAAFSTSVCHSLTHARARAHFLYLSTSHSLTHSFSLTRSLAHSRSLTVSLSQYVPDDAPGDVREAVEHAECCICCDALCDQPTAVLTRRHKRICGHFFHAACCEALVGGHHGGKTCPICRAEYDAILPVPSIEADPVGWFRAVDVDGDGRLSQDEVREVLKAQLSVDWRKLEDQLPALWDQWDRDGDGTIDQQEMIRLARYMRDRKLGLHGRCFRSHR